MQRCRDAGQVCSGPRLVLTTLLKPQPRRSLELSLVLEMLGQQQPQEVEKESVMVALGPCPQFPQWPKRR